MPEQFVAKDKQTGFEVTVTGEFPEHPDDRTRIARTTTLFTRLMSTLLQRDETQRRMGFRAIETQLELADALIRQDHDEVQRLVRETLATMGVGEDQLRELAQRLAEAGGFDPRVAEELARAFGIEEVESVLEGNATTEDDEDDALDPKLMRQLEDLLASAEAKVDQPEEEQPDESDDASDEDSDDAERPKPSE